MKKLASLFLALALCLSLSIPASASIHDFYIYDADGETIAPNDVPGLSFTDGGAVLNGVNGIDLTLGSSPTIILAPGSKNTLLRLIGGDSDYTNDMTIKGTGELILYSPKPLSFAEGYGAFSGLITSLKLEDGLVMTGGAKEGDSYPLSVQLVERDPVNDFPTYSCCTADGTRAQYVRIAPKAGAAPSETAKPSTPAAPSSTGFSDVPDSHYAASAIKNCVAKGIVSGYNDGTFKPTASVTRAQFCVMLARAFYPDGLKEKETAANKAKGWFVPASATLHDLAAGHGVLAGTSFENGYADSTVMGQPISRYDMAQVMSNIMSEKDCRATDAQKKEAQTKIKDWASVPQKQRDAVAACYALGIIGGQSDGTFGGSKTMNRAQGCVVIDRMEKYVSSAASQPAQPSQPTETSKPTETAKPSPEAAVAELVRLLNAERTKAGLKALESMDGLTKAAEQRAKDLSGGYIEIRADGSDWTSVVKQAGIPADYVDESFVVGKGYDTAAAALEMVLSTPEAREALMNPEYTHMSVGYVHDDNGYGGYQDFWSLLYIIRSGSGSSGGSSSGGSSSGNGSGTGEAPSGTDLQSMRQGVLDLVNAARAQNGKAPLTLNDSLSDVAQLRADEIVQSFSHTRPNGTSCFTALKEAGISYRTTGENIAAGQGSPASVMDSWMNSEGHRANILNGDFTSIGIGYVKAGSGYGHYWVQMFLG
nr:CAP domain-containing protein [uncultured Oscillibacter sp.]